MVLKTQLEQITPPRMAESGNGIGPDTVNCTREWLEDRLISGKVEYDADIIGLGVRISNPSLVEINVLKHILCISLRLSVPSSPPR